MENFKPEKSAIDKAKEIIEKKKSERLTQEELAKQEEGLRLDILFKKVSELNNEMERLMKDKELVIDKQRENEKATDNNISTRKQVITLLKNDSDVMQVLKEDKTKEDLGHTERRELLNEVMEDPQNERRVLKKEKKENTKSRNTISNKYNKIVFELEELKKDPDYLKLQESLEKEYRKEYKNERNFFNDKMKERNFYAVSDLKSLNEWADRNKENVLKLRQYTEETLKEVFNEVNDVFRNAENDEMYRKDKIKDVDVTKYKLFGQKKYNDLSFNVRDEYADKLKIKEVEAIQELLQKDLHDASELVRIANYEAMNRMGNLIFDTATKYKREVEEQNKRIKFLSMIDKGIDQRLGKIFSKSYEDTNFKTAYDINHISRLCAKYCNVLRMNKDKISEEKGFPKITDKEYYTTEEFFSWGEGKHKPTGEMMDDYEQVMELKKRRDEARNKYEMVAGKGKAGILNIY